MPISWRGTLQQYVGRLQRLHEGSKTVRVYDYVDANVPMPARMYEKRITGYRALGYEFESDLQPTRGESAQANPGGKTAEPQYCGKKRPLHDFPLLYDNGFDGSVARHKIAALEAGGGKGAWGEQGFR